MKKILALCLLGIAALMAMGFASRDGRPIRVQAGGAHNYEMHLEYYQAISRSLVASDGPVSALCDGHRTETARITE